MFQIPHRFLMKTWLLQAKSSISMTADTSNSFTNLRHFRDALKLQSIIIIVVAIFNLLIRLRRWELFRKSLRSRDRLTSSYSQCNPEWWRHFVNNSRFNLLRFGKSFLHPISHRGIVFRGVVTLWLWVSVLADMSFELLAELFSACLRALPVHQLVTITRQSFRVIYSNARGY